MSVIAPLQDAAHAVRSHPILIGYVLMMTIVYAVLGAIPLVGILAILVIAPFMLGGMYGVLDLALDGTRPDTDDFITRGTENFASLIGAYTLMGFIVGVVMVVFAFVLGVVIFSTGAGSEQVAEMSVVTALMVVAMLGGLFIAMLFLQFIDVAIVIGGYGAVDSFKESWRVFRADPLGVVGYTVLRTLLAAAGTVAVYIVFTVAIGMGVLSGSDTATIGALVLAIPIAGLAQVVLTTLVNTYHVAFYRRAMQ